jgi:cytoskeletal protein RodZ
MITLLRISFLQDRGMGLARRVRRAASAPGGFVKKIQSLSFLATLAISLGMISWGSALHAQTTPSTTPDRQAQQPSSSPDTTPTQQTPQTQPTPSPETPPADQQTPSAQGSDTQGSQTGSQGSQTGSQGSQTGSQTPGQTPDANAPQSGSTAGSTSRSGSSAATGTDTQTFSGTVTKQGDKYVLKDDSGQTYDIDHQPEVAKFDGKRVRVQGTLDPSGKKILVK